MSGQSKSQLSIVKKSERAKRQSILMRIVESAQAKGETPSFAEVGRRMRQDPWVKQRWPSYGGVLASRDFETIMELTRDDIRALAIPYFIRQTGILDEVSDIMLEIVKDDSRDDDTRISAANTLQRYVGQSIKLFGNEAPKEFHVNRQSVHGTIDDFKKLKAEAQQEMESDITVVPHGSEPDDIEDGEFEEE